MSKSGIRAKLFNAKHKVISVDLDGEQCFVRSPTFRERTDMIQNATITNPDGTSRIDVTKLQITALIALTIDANNEKCFDEDDRVMLMNSPISADMDELLNAASKVLNIEKQTSEDIGKNS